MTSNMPIFLGLLLGCKLVNLKLRQLGRLSPFGRYLFCRFGLSNWENRGQKDGVGPRS